MWGALSVAIVAANTCLGAVLGGPSTGPRELDSVICAGDPDLRASLERITQGSALWREALQGLRGSSRRVWLLTPTEATSEAARQLGIAPPEDATVAEAVPLVRAGGEVAAVVVIVNVPLLVRVHETRRSLPAELWSDLDRILVHEIYGHALPYLAAGHLSGRCADPREDERPSDACAIRRENAVRSELRLGRRVDAGLEGLALSRRGH